MQERGRVHPSAASVFSSFTHALSFFSQKTLVLGKEPNQSNGGCWILANLLKSCSLQGEAWTLPVNPLTHTPNYYFPKVTVIKFMSPGHWKASNSKIMSNTAYEITPWTMGFELKLEVVSIFFYETLNTGLSRWDGGVIIEEWETCYNCFMKATKFPLCAHTTFSIQSPIFCKSKSFT